MRPNKQRDALYMVRLGKHVDWMDLVEAIGTLFAQGFGVSCKTRGFAAQIYDAPGRQIRHGLERLGMHAGAWWVGYDHVW